MKENCISDKGKHPDMGMSMVSLHNRMTTVGPPTSGSEGRLPVVSPRAARRELWSQDGQLPHVLYR